MIKGKMISVPIKDNVFDEFKSIVIKERYSIGNKVAILIEEYVKSRKDSCNNHFG